MEGESPIPDLGDVLLNAMLLSVLGLYETIELMKKEDDDKYWIDDSHFNVVIIGGTHFKQSLALLKEQFVYQFTWFKFQIRMRKKADRAARDIFEGIQI